MQKKIWHVALAGLCIAAALVAPHAAGAAAATTFTGSCTATGLASSSPPIGIIPAAVGTYSAVGVGTCSGRLNGEQLRAARIHVDISMVDYLHSCVGGYGTAQVDVAFPNGQHLQVDQTGTGLAMLAHGVSGGSAIAMFTAYTQVSEQSPDLMQQCLTQSLVVWHFQWTLATITPLSS